ncbi:peptidoglycan-binding protein LysM [Enterococcus casseliflavus]|nr:peptidoglycan-binding protein LysM [Enterococcus casseliflavus]
MSKKVFVSLIVGAAAGVVFFTSGNDAQASEVNRVWTPRTVEQIKADVAKAKNNQYTIVWGDTMWGISQATNLTVQKLSELNKIANVDLIYAGNTLVFDGNVVTAKNDKGETVAQSVVTPQDKNDASKPVGKQEPAKSTTDKTKTATPGQNEQGTTATSEKTDKSSQETNTTVSGTSGSVEGTTTSSGKVETPAQPSKPATPSQPTQPSKPTEKPSTPIQPTTPTQPITGGEQGGATTPATPDTTPINMGNSGKVFDSEEAASEYGYAEIANEKSPWYGYSFGAEQLLNKDYELLGTWTVSFLEEGYASGDLIE